MARARNIKPGFFANEDLVELPFETRLLFIGLWTIADRAGRLYDRPKTIKMALFPADAVDVDAMLDGLVGRGFIWRYEVDGVKCIQIITWEKHQNPHMKETASSIPAPTLNTAETTKEQSEYHASTVQNDFLPEQALLIPLTLNLVSDSGFPKPDSGFSDSLQEQQTATAVAAPPKKKPTPTKKQATAEPGTGRVWIAYAKAYWDRYGVEPVRNAMVNGQFSNMVKRLGVDDAEGVAGFFVTHNGKFYVEKMHAVGIMLQDCEKLRTEWATGHKVTSAAAKEADRLQDAGDMWNRIINEQGS